MSVNVSIINQWNRTFVDFQGDLIQHSRISNNEEEKLTGMIKLSAHPMKLQTCALNIISKCLSNKPASSSANNVLNVKELLPGKTKIAQRQL